MCSTGRKQPLNFSHNKINGHTGKYTWLCRGVVLCMKIKQIQTRKKRLAFHVNKTDESDIPQEAKPAWENSSFYSSCSSVKMKDATPLKSPCT